MSWSSASGWPALQARRKPVTCGREAESAMRCLVERVGAATIHGWHRDEPVRGHFPRVWLEGNAMTASTRTPARRPRRHAAHSERRYPDPPRGAVIGRFRVARGNRPRRLRRRLPRRGHPSRAGCGPEGDRRARLRRWLHQAGPARSAASLPGHRSQCGSTLRSGRWRRCRCAGHGTGERLNPGVTQSPWKPVHRTGLDDRHAARTRAGCTPAPASCTVGTSSR